MVHTEVLEVEGASTVSRLVLPSGHVTIFDAADAELVAQHAWCASVVKTTTYAQSGGQRRPTVLMHRLLLGAPEGYDVDHRNGNGLDNRRCNLRLATRAENCANKPLMATNKSGYKGVCWSKATQKWHAAITIRGQRQHLGFFEDPWDAAQAYNAAAIAGWGEFARINERVAG